MIVPPTLLAVDVGVASVVVVVVVSSGVVVVVVVVIWLESAHCLHFSRTGLLQDQHPAPERSWQEEGMFSSRHCWQAAISFSVARSEHCVLQFPS